MPTTAAAPRRVSRRSNGIRTRAEIVAAAERHFAERGFDATRLDDIANEVGIRRAAIFYHFGDKQELYSTVLDGVFVDWTADLPSGGGPAERLEGALTAGIDYIAKRPSVARLILREAASVQPGVVSPFVRAARAPIAWFQAVIEEGVASGELKPVVEPRRFLSLMGAITVFHFFAAMPWLTETRPVDPWSRDALVEHKREILLLARGMLGIETALRTGAA